MSRSRKPVAHKQSIKVVLHLTPAEKRRLDAAAKREGLPVATAARLYALRAADSGS
jgi:hypothetical protein